MMSFQFGKRNKKTKLLVLLRISVNNMSVSLIN